MAEGLFDGGEKQYTTGESSSDVPQNQQTSYFDEFIYMEPRWRDDKSNSEEIIYPEPRWRDDVPDDDTPDSYNGTAGGKVRELQKHALDKAHREFLDLGGEEQIRRLEGDTQRVVLGFDPDSPLSILRAAGGLIRPLARSVGERLVPTYDPVEAALLRPVPLPPSPPPATVREAVRQFSGLPEGPIIPEEVKEAVSKILDGVVERKPQLVLGTAASLAAVIALSGLPTSTPSQAEVSDVLRGRPVAEALSGPVTPPEPISVQLISAKLQYVPSRPTHLRAVANDLKVPIKNLIRSNPDLNPAAEIPAGTKIRGVVQSSAVELGKTTSLVELASAYGLTTDAVRSVNTVDENEAITGQVVIPGRQVIETGMKLDADTGAVAKHLGLSATSSRELSRVNAKAPEGQIVIPITASVARDISLPDAKTVTAVATGQLLPNSPSETTTPVEPEVQTPVSNSSTTVKPEDSEASTTTTAPPAPAGPPNQETTSTTVPQPAVLPEVKPEAPVVTTVERPATPEEKFNKDIQAIHDALDHALASGDLGPLNHLVTYSPIFKGYNLTPEQQSAGMRHLPPANFFGDWIAYEFGQETPDNERVGNSQLLSALLYYAYSLQQEIKGNPAWAIYSNACARFNDMTASEGHQTHKRGINADVNSAMVCNIGIGHSSADGPTGWVNRSAAISHTISNPNYDFDLDYRLIDRMRKAQIDGTPILRSILFNAPQLPSIVVPHKNHGNHEHWTVNGAYDTSLAIGAHGGGRPEKNLDDFRAKVLLTYFAGQGVPGLSLDLKITETVVTPPSLEPEQGTLPTSESAPTEQQMTSTTAAPPPTIPQEPSSTVPEVPATTVPPAPITTVTAPKVAEEQQSVELPEGEKHAFVRALLLTEIASHEGGYDSVNRGGAGDTKVGDASYKRIFGDRTLSQHTIGELMELQRRGVILAIGRYQFIGKTFRSAVDALHMDHNKVFDAETQDYMATNYLIFMKRPNLAAYIKGDSSKAYLAQEDLCKEFASIPCNNGNGHYDGDSAGNGSAGGKLRVAKFRQLLEAMQQTYLAAQKEILEKLAAVQQPAT